MRNKYVITYNLNVELNPPSIPSRSFAEIHALVCKWSKLEQADQVRLTYEPDETFESTDSVENARISTDGVWVVVGSYSLNQTDWNIAYTANGVIGRREYVEETAKLATMAALERAQDEAAAQEARELSERATYAGMA